MISSYRFRLYLLAAMVMGGFLLLLQRLWTLQIDEQQKYIKGLPGTSAQRQRIPGVRGEIRDANGLALARNRTTLEIGINLGEVEAYWKELHRDELNKKRDKAGNKFEVPVFVFDTRKEPETDIIALLNEVLFPRLDAMGLYNKPDEDEIKQIRLHYRTYRGVVPYTYKPIPGNLRRTRLEMNSEADFERFIAIAENLSALPGVKVRNRATREYPFRALGSHYIGYVRDPKNTLPPGENQKDWDYYEVDDIGIAGLEKSLDADLRAKPGVRVLLKDEHGKTGDEIKSESVESVPGSDFYLTIDSRIQTIADNAMLDAQPVAVGRGAVVVMDPNTGEVLALSSVPSFDPNTFIPFISADDWSHYNIEDKNYDPTIPMLNRAMNSYAPGSTFKIITALAGSMKGFGSKPYNCSGAVPYGNREFPCWTRQKGIGGHGTLTLEGAVMRSCNCFFYQMGNDARIETIDKVARLFHVGQPSGLHIDGDTYYQGAHGLMPNPTWWKDQPGGGAWTSAKTANISIGQGEVLATPLQMCTVACAIANGGKVFHPKLVKRQKRYDLVRGVRTDRMVELPSQLSADLLELGVKKRDVATIGEGMIAVVNSPSGTARRAKSEDKIAGKTGTAQMWRKPLPGEKVDPSQMKDGRIKDNHTWFIAYAPYDNPRIAVAVVVANGEAGGAVAAPIAKRVIEQSLATMDGKYQPLVRPRDPAPGHFRHLSEVKYDGESVPDDATGDDPDAVEVDEEPAVEVKSVQPGGQPTIRRAEVLPEDAVPNVETGREAAPPAGAARVRKKNFQENQSRTKSPDN